MIISNNRKRTVNRKNLVLFWVAILFSANVFACSGGHYHQDKSHHAFPYGDSSAANKHMHRTPFHELVKRFEDPERANWQKPELVIGKLGDLRSKVIADIGAGTGYFTFPLAQKAKKVIAVDIDERFLKYIEDKRASLSGVLPMETRLAAEDDPRLTEREVDIVIIVNTYHHIENRLDYMSRVKKALSKEGKVIIIDYKKSSPIGPPLRLRLTASEVKDELRAAGFRNVSIDTDSLPRQYMISASV